MAIGALGGRIEDLRPAQLLLQQNFGLDASSAADVVQDVLLQLFSTGPKRLDYPRRYLLRACRWRALRLLRSRKQRDSAAAVVENRGKLAKDKNREVLVALEEEDKPKFFGQPRPSSGRCSTSCSKGIT